MPLRLFLPITKVDVEQRTVYGRAVQEVPDKAAEVFDYASSKPLFSAWSETIAKASDGKNLGNVRAMHGKVAAGKLTQIAFNDEEKAIDVAAKVVDDAEWQKCLEGVYTGFSIGGKYAKRWPDEANPALTRYTAEPSEISLVDNPCVPTATFTMVKADGTTEAKPFQRLAVLKALLDDASLTIGDLLGLLDEYLPADEAQKLAGTETTTLGDVKSALRKFAAETPVTEAPAGDAPATPPAPAGDDANAAEKVARRTDTSPKEGESTYGDVAFADPTNKKYPIDTEAHIRAAWNYINKPKNAAKYSPKDVQAIKARIVAAWKKVIDKDGPPKADAKSEKLAKGMYAVTRLAEMLESLRDMADDAEYEAVLEGDGSPIPGQLRDWVRQGAEILTAMTAEEVSEMLAAMRGAEKGAGTADDLAKAGARHSRKDLAMLQAIHDHAVNLGADCAGMDSEKSTAGDELAKGAEQLAKLEASVATLTASLEKVSAERTALQARVAKLEAMPAPAKGVVKVVNKEDDHEVIPPREARGADASAEKTAAPAASADPLALMKAAHQRPLLISSTAT
jgi:hypothetical protein